MPWRVVQLGPERWHVAVAAEWRASSPHWGLAFSFRAAASDGSRAAIWVRYPFESASKAALFTRAESIPDDELSALLVEQLAAHQAQ